MCAVEYDPAEGRYGWQASPSLPDPPAGTQMTAPELAKCKTSDDDRFVNASSDGSPYHIFRFDSINDAGIGSLFVQWEGYATCWQPILEEEWMAARRLWIWNWDTETWDYVGYDAVDQPESAISKTYTGAEAGPYISGGNQLWLGVYHYACPYSSGVPHRLYTDDVFVRVSMGAEIAEAGNLFGQCFRTFNTGDENDISFERLDYPGASWSSPTQPFSGDNNHSSDIDCLSTGWLHAAYLDSDGVLQQALSKDDGATWEAA